MSPPFDPAGYLHDIGKVAVDKRLFGKPTVLDAEEFREMADHTTVGHQIVTGVQFPWPFVPEVVRWHHERADGSGYPDGLLNEEIPMQARIVGLADTFDAMTSPRPYRERISLGATLSEIVRNAPQRFDPVAVQALLVQLRRDAVGSNRAPFLEAASRPLGTQRYRSVGRQSSAQDFQRTPVPDLRSLSTGFKTCNL